eukprot:Awhi_evm1s671
MFGQALFLSILALGLDHVYGHGAMVVPKSRNMVARFKGEEFCPHCLSAGGPGHISGLTPGGNYIWPETKKSSVRQGLCGNPADSDLVYQQPGPISKTYQSGQIIDIQIQITAHHKGHFEFWLCDQAEVTFECLNKYHLVRAEDSTHPLSPIDSEFPERYYLEPSCAGDSPNNFDDENQANLIPKSQRITMKYKLPEGVTCDHCVLQWWWGSGNSCLIPDSRSFNYPQDTCDSWTTGGITDCGNGAYPEEFWNCADIKITNNGASAPAMSEVATTTTTDETETRNTAVMETTVTTTTTTATSTIEAPTSSSTETGSCRSLVAHITDQWCEDTKCDPAYLGTFCTNGDLAESTASARKCVSLQSHITDEWCQQSNCDPAYLGTSCAYADTTEEIAINGEGQPSTAVSLTTPAILFQLLLMCFLLQ